MLILGIDPGAKPGYALIRVDDRHPVLLGHSKSRVVVPKETHVVVERPKLRPRAKLGQSRRKQSIDPNTVVTLAFTAGRQIGYYEAICDTTVYLDVREWKDRLFRGGSTLPKQVFIDRIKLAWGGLPGLSDDEVDALGIAWAYSIGLE